MWRRLVRAGVVLLLLAALAGGYIVYPFATLYRLQQAVNERDADTIDALVDWPQLRSNLKTQFKLSMLDKMKTDTGAAASLGGVLGSMLGANLADGVLDIMISPAGLRKMLAHPPTEAVAPMTLHSARMLSPTLVRATARLGNDPKAEMPISLELSGGVWRLTSLDLPFDLIGQDVDRAIQKTLGKNRGPK